MNCSLSLLCLSSCLLSELFSQPAASFNPFLLSELTCLFALLIQLSCSGQLLAPFGMSCSASFSELFRCLLSAQLAADCILSVPSGRCCSLFSVLLIELCGCAVVAAPFGRRSNQRWLRM